MTATDHTHTPEDSAYWPAPAPDPPHDPDRPDLNRPYAGLWERLDSDDLPAPPLQDWREASWPPHTWDADLERAFRKIRRKRRDAQRLADRHRERVDEQTGRHRWGIAGRTPTTRRLQALADWEARHAGLLELERELGRYRPGLLARRSLPAPARRRTALDM